MSTSSLLSALGLSSSLHVEHIRRSLIDPKAGAYYKLFVPPGKEISFTISWELPQIMLYLRIMPESEFEKGINNRSVRTVSWAFIYGNGLIKGRFYPPFPGSWVLFVDLVAGAWPNGKVDPLEIDAKILAVPPAD